MIMRVTPGVNAEIGRLQKGGSAVTTEIYWVHDFQPGRLAIMPCPRGGEMLEDELRYLANLDVKILASLLTDEDVLGYALELEEKLCAKVGIEYLSFPIQDHDVPASTAAATAFIESLAARLANGQNIAVHCLAGIGRSGLICSCLLVTAGFSPRQAFTKLSAARGIPSPETDEQKTWVTEFSEALGHG